MTTVLVVDDNDDIRSLLALKMELFGFEVATAGNGAEALEQVKMRKPALILMDMNMPLMNGWEATRILKNDAEYSSIPVIALSAYSYAGDRERARSAGCEGFHSKPIDMDQLLIQISTLFEHSPQ